MGLSSPRVSSPRKDWKPINYLLGLLLLFMSTAAWSCTCWGTAPIEVAIAGHPILVEGRVISLDQVDDQRFGKLTLSATLRVAKVIKGSVGADDITVVQTMCYASLDPGNMQMHHTYLLPLEMPAPEPPPVENGVATAIDGPKAGQYEMAHCAHSGLELVDGELYKFDEGHVGLERQMTRYMPYTAFRIWWPVAQAGLLSVGFVWDLHKKFGLSALVLSLLLGTTGAYFAARYRPWMLIPVVLLASALCAMNFGDLLASRDFLSDHGILYQTLSWVTPVVILGSGVLGYIVRRRVKSSARGVQAH